MSPTEERAGGGRQGRWRRVRGSGANGVGDTGLVEGRPRRCNGRSFGREPGQTTRMVSVVHGNPGAATTGRGPQRGRLGLALGLVAGLGLAGSGMVGCNSHPIYDWLDRQRNRSMHGHLLSKD